MVHKKSEYELQFRTLSNDTRAQIWKENFLFREAQKRMNLSDHYWRYQLIDDACDCEDGSDKHVGLERLNTINMPGDGKKNHPFHEDKEVQTVDQGEFTNRELVEFEIRDPKEKNNESTEKELDKVAVSTVLNTSSPLKDQAVLNLPTSHCKREEHYIHSKNHVELCKDKAHTKSVELVPASTANSHLNPLPTRDAVKSYHFGQMTPVFTAFGWNDSDKNVGEQKTFNVRAPADQVHKSALLSSGKKHKDLELYFAEQLKKRRQEKSLLSLGPVNLSSIWMTEYQEKFSKGHRGPLVQSPFRRPVVWRYS